jgi:mannose-6-phosphate isomerase-like protein (cupin superfamily)
METIAHEGVVLAYVVRGGPTPTTTKYLTPDECSLQVGHVVYPADTEIPRHAHLPVERHLVGTAEVLIVQQGRCEVDIYSDARVHVRTCTLGVGDIVISVGGGHGFRVLEDLVLLEIKQGPYPGKLAEKALF